ncbi:MAG: hypothetical protein D6707_07515, partial [Bacteroidetes bacterium]
MINGLILEGLVFGFKDESVKKRKKNLFQLEAEAKILKPYFPKKGEAYKMIEAETDDFIMQGEVDYYTDNMLYDLKRTKQFDYWERKSGILDFLQGYYYPYIIYCNTGKIIPFTYVVYAVDIGI